jgi:hypothetical protein
MRTHSKKPSATLLGCLCTVALLTSCSTDAPTGPTETQVTPDQVSADRVSLCHRTGSDGAIITVSRSALAAHLRQGDYLTSLSVSHASGQPNDGAHFHRIGDAIAAVRAGRLGRGELRSAACRITITVAPGPFRGTSADAADQELEHFPLVVDVPDITLLGAFVMQLDASGRATGLSATTRRTTLEPEPGVDDATAIILANGHPGGSAGHGLVVEGFAMKGLAAYAVFAVRVRRLVIRGNRFEGNFGVTLDFRATSAVIERNQVRGTFLCDMCLAGPGVYRVTGNRLLTGAIEGILTVPALDPVFNAPFEVEPSDLPAAAEVSADITNNEVRDHRQFPGSAGVRMAGIGIGTPDVRGTTHVRVHHNRLVNNTFGVMVEAGFPEPDTRLRSDIDVVLGGNTIERSCQADLYVTFEPHSGSPEPGDLYLRNSTYRLTLGGDVLFRDAWFSNPAGFGNTLLVDGRTIGHGTRQPFDPDTCPARTGAASSVAQSVE